MKHTCPRCKQPGIGGLAKRWSSRGAPAACDACGGLCHVLGSTSSGIWAAGVVIVVLSSIAALDRQSYPLFFCGVALAIACNLWAWRRAKMVPISRQSAANAGKVGWVTTGIWALLAIFK